MESVESGWFIIGLHHLKRTIKAGARWVFWDGGAQCVRASESCARTPCCIHTTLICLSHALYIVATLYFLLTQDVTFFCRIYCDIKWGKIRFKMLKAQNVWSFYLTMTQINCPVSEGGTWSICWPESWYLETPCVWQWGRESQQTSASLR